MALIKKFRIKSFKEIDFIIITAKPNYPHGKIYQNYSKFGPIIENFFNHKIYHVPVIPRHSGNSLFLFLHFFKSLDESIPFIGFSLAGNISSKSK